MHNRVKRIFFLGAHKVLVRTELPRLRQLGYEVFNPPYLSDVKDQSAEYNWDSTQPSTLPREVFEQLARCNFFYKEISQKIIDLLNQYFYAVVVTIHPTWLYHLIQGFKGKIIYRTYGQFGHVSAALNMPDTRCVKKIVEHNDFWFLPHANEAITYEHTWLKERAIAVPYTLTEDIFPFQDTWSGDTQEIALCCPNLSNTFFRQHYEYLKRHFGESHFKFYGVQLEKSADAQIAGSLPRGTLIQRFRHAAGYLYTYTDPNVCYLPPIEMMTLGGPVLFLRGSLLDKYMPDGAPGRCRDESDAKRRCELLLRGDKAFIQEILATQREVRQRYHPDYVWPIFDKTFESILKNTLPRSGNNWIFNSKKIANNSTRRVYLLHHFPQPLITHRDGQYSAFEGIVKVMREIVSAVADTESTEVVITCGTEEHLPYYYGFFNNGVFGENVKIFNVEKQNILSFAYRVAYNVRKWISNSTQTPAKKTWQRWTRMGQNSWNTFLDYCARGVIYCGKKLNFLNGYIDYILFCKLKHKSNYVKIINDDPRCTSVVIPHYCAFADSCGIEQTTCLYLPDYMPYFFQKNKACARQDNVEVYIGKKVAQHADRILTNSHFSKNYLDKCALKVDTSKVNVLYLPPLKPRRQTNKLSIRSLGPIEQVAEKPFLFYPTQARPNKNLSCLFEIFERLVDKGHDLHLALTRTVTSEPQAHKRYSKLRCKERVFFLNGISDGEMELLYKQAAILSFTSIAEGNFPPQIYEALYYETPIIAFKMGFITERVPEDLQPALMMAPQGDVDGFVHNCEYILANRESVVAQQRGILNHLRSCNDEKVFAEGIRNMLLS